MLTPKFSLSQDPEFLFINIYAPHLKVEEAEIDVSDDEVYFYCRPYFLRLHLTGNVLEDERSKSSYDADSGWLKLKLPKQKSGEYFDNLDMLTQLLTPKSASNVSVNVEVLNSEEHETGCGEENENNCATETTPDDQDEDFDWFIDQSPVEESATATLLSAGYCYGFANSKNNPLNPLLCELPDMIDLIDPDNVSSKERSALRHQQECDKFDCEHYLADLFEDAPIKEVASLSFKELTGSSDGVSAEFTEREKELMLQLPRREYIIEDGCLPSVYLGLVDLLLAYAYDFRQTRGEHSVESDWTICKLSSSLSWLESFTDLKHVVVSFGRRCLCLPLYRHWSLIEKVVSDVRTILAVGKSQILKCLLNLRAIVTKSEAHFPLVDIFLTDYCVWVQSACPKRLASLSQALADLQLCKDDVGFRLVEMESDAAKLMEDSEESGSDEDSDLNKLSAAVSNVVKISNANDSDDDDGDTDDDRSSSSEEETSSSEYTTGSESDDEPDKTVEMTKDDRK